MTFVLFSPLTNIYLCCNITSVDECNKSQDNRMDTPMDNDNLRSHLPEILALRAQGGSLRRIGAKYGRSYERVRQLLDDGDGADKKLEKQIRIFVQAQEEK